MTSRVDLVSKYPTYMVAREYAYEMHISLSTLKRQLRAATYDVPPRKTTPYRWLTVEVERHVNETTLAEDRRAKASFARAKAKGVKTRKQAA